MGGRSGGKTVPAAAQFTTPAPPVRNRLKTGKRLFQPGQSGNPRGRPRGAKSKVSVEAKAAAARIVDDPVYRENLLEAARAGTPAPAIEVLLWHYAKGKPTELVQMDVLASPFCLNRVEVGALGASSQASEPPRTSLDRTRHKTPDELDVISSTATIDLDKLDGMTTAERETARVLLRKLLGRE